MKRITRLMTILMVTGMLALTLTSLSSAKETIEVRKAGGESYVYTIMAYDNFNKTYYTLSGTINSDPFRILVPKGWASVINVLGPKKASGSRNFYQQKDDLNPILEIRKVSQYVLELVRVGYGPKTMATNAKSVFSKALSPDGSFERKPPQ